MRVAILTISDRSARGENSRSAHMRDGRRKPRWDLTVRDNATSGFATVSLLKNDTWWYMNATGGETNYGSNLCGVLSFRW